uniref:Uncharacterized protein n=1 Tax=Ditylenchus dipsaci TaxID=166011 RepID=A0A915ENQ2_9BILA
MSGNNPNQQQRGGFNPNFNPNAASFVPNARAMPFVPGQAYQQPYGMPPPPQGFPFNPQMIQQQHMMQQQPPYQNQVPPFQPPPFYAAAQNHPQNYAQFHQQQNSCVSPMQAGPPLQSNQQFAGNSPNAPKTEAPTPAECKLISYNIELKIFTE